MKGHVKPPASRGSKAKALKRPAGALSMSAVPDPWDPIRSPTADTIFILSRVVVSPSDGDANINLFREKAEWLLPFCRVEVGQIFEHNLLAHEKPDTFMWMEEWQEMAGFLRHCTTEHGKSFHSLVDPFIAENCRTFRVANVANTNLPSEAFMKSTRLSHAWVIQGFELTTSEDPEAFIEAFINDNTVTRPGLVWNVWLQQEACEVISCTSDPRSLVWVCEFDDVEAAKSFSFSSPNLTSRELFHGMIKA